MGYAYFWEYVVRPEAVDDFAEAYGNDGVWVQLFRKADGYVRTELHRDLSDPCRFVTVDYWQSLEAWETFRETLSDEFEALDHNCARFTLTEREIGRFATR